MPWHIEGFTAPVKTDTLKTLAKIGDVQPNTLIRRNDGEWQAAATVKGLFPHLEPEKQIDPHATPAGLWTLQMLLLVPVGFLIMVVLLFFFVK